MARGWESKSVEEQQSDKLDRRAFESNPLTPEQAEREGLLLQRKRILLAIGSSTNPRYIEQQNKALGFIEEKLNKLDE
ncbi:MAG: hypothetical protein JWO80_5997 [Bryobacterales bacterium]|jgi:hypothetical protein|nr:hypothetical protein [Bryobacterales bacterium]